MATLKEILKLDSKSRLPHREPFPSYIFKCLRMIAMLTPRHILEDIRREQYGIGLPADPASSPVIANMRSKLDRALKLLSTDRYAR